MGVITLTTDFGLSDSYVAQMKGLILTFAPESVLIDLTHDIPPCDILKAARILSEAVPLFPEGSVHLAVVDPGVGGKRRRIIVRATVQSEADTVPKSVWLVGPDNGIFSIVAPRERRTGVWEISQLHRLPPFASGTSFEGRNIFSPVAAQLSARQEPADFGTPLDLMDARLVDLETLSAPVMVDGIVKGQIVYFDHFGNAATNIPRALVGMGKGLITLPKRSLTLELRHSFEQFRASEPGCIINSQGFVEIVINRGSAQRELQLDIGDYIQLSPA